MRAVRVAFGGLCTTNGAVVTPQGTVQGKTATINVIVTNTTCDWEQGPGRGICGLP